MAGRCQVGSVYVVSGLNSHVLDTQVSGLRIDEELRFDGKSLLSRLHLPERPIRKCTVAALRVGQSASSRACECRIVEDALAHPPIERHARCSTPPNAEGDVCAICQNRLGDSWNVPGIMLVISVQQHQDFGMSLAGEEPGAANGRPLTQV